jgi:DNA-binding response OmpR family regulator/Flp pilus assembly protein TadD
MAGMELPRRVLIVEDDPMIVRQLSNFLERNKIAISTAVDLSTALYQLKTQPVEAALISVEFKQLPGLAVAQKIRLLKADLKSGMGIVMMRGAREMKKEESSLYNELGNMESIAKPFEPVQILAYLARALRTFRSHVAYEELNGKIIQFYRGTGDLAKAIDVVKKKMAEIGDRGIDLLMSLYEEAGDAESLLTLTSKVMERPDRKEDIRLINRRGHALMKLGRFEEARNFLELADTLAPSNIARMSEMADMYLAVNEPEKSLKVSEKLLDLNPEEADMKFNVMGNLMQKGHVELARQLCQRTASPQEIVRHYNNKGVLLAKESKQSEALLLYNQALSFYPEHPENYRILFNIALAHINHKQGEYVKDARAALDHCLSLNPGFEKAKALRDKLSKPATASAGNPAPEAKSDEAA